MSFPVPGIVWGAYPQRPSDSDADGAIERLAAFARGLVAPLAGRGPNAYSRFARLVDVRATGAAASLPDLRAALAREGLTDAVCADVFATAIDAAWRHLGYRPHRGQIVAARALIDRRLAEMATGEGKTLAIALAAATAALAGAPVHVITANDYLAARDAQALTGFYAALGLSVGAITEPMKLDERYRAYRADIVYCTARELVFDYMRDGLAHPRQSDLARRARRLYGAASPLAPTLLRGLCMAIVDEADTVLIDEARMPLVLSKSVDDEGEAALLAAALALARTLTVGADFTLDAETRRTSLTEHGRDRVAAMPHAGGTAGANRRHREDRVCLALTALNSYRRDRDYVVQGDAVLIVDDTTGRGAPGRAWSRGLHQLIELKEGLAPTARGQTVAQITYQRFFARYLHLSGLSGTLGGCAGEMRAIYGLSLVRVPRDAPLLRRQLPARLCIDDDALFRDVARRCAEVVAEGRPVLVGTATVAESEHLSRRLGDAGIEHALLNARQDGAEAAIVARAGAAGRVTVATSMAGRGTDIALGHGVAARGGLHVILCQHNNAGRIDLQFIGRAARRGANGSCETWLSLEAPLLARAVPAHWRDALCRLAGRAPVVVRIATRSLQWFEEFSQSSQRKTLCRADAKAERDLSFSGGTST